MAGTNSRPLWHRPGLIDKQVALYTPAYKPRWEDFVKRVVSKDSWYYQMATVSDIGAFSQVDELVDNPVQTLETPFAHRIVPLGYGGSFVVSDEAYRRDPNGLYKKVPKFLARGYMKSMDNEAAGFLARANDAGFIVTDDGLALASAVHLTQSGTFSNISPNNPPLTYAAAKSGIVLAKQHVTYLGENMELDGPWALLAPTPLIDVAEMIVNNMNGGMRYDTTDHEPNWVRTRAKKVIEIPRSTSSTAWAWVPIRDEENPLVMVEGLSPRTIYEEKGGNFSHHFHTRGMFAIGAERPQGFQWSAGDGS